jgi:hypothetical protein
MLLCVIDYKKVKAVLPEIAAGLRMESHSMHTFLSTVTAVAYSPSENTGYLNFQGSVLRDQ